MPVLDGLDRFPIVYGVDCWETSKLMLQNLSFELGTKILNSELIF